jgi:hypothetical protein
VRWRRSATASDCIGGPRAFERGAQPVWAAALETACEALMPIRGGGRRGGRGLGAPSCDDRGVLSGGAPVGGDLVHADVPPALQRGDALVDRADGAGVEHPLVRDDVGDLQHLVAMEGAITDRALAGPEAVAAQLLHAGHLPAVRDRERVTVLRVLQVRGRSPVSDRAHLAIVKIRGDDDGLADANLCGVAVDQVAFVVNAGDRRSRRLRAEHRRQHHAVVGSGDRRGGQRVAEARVPDLRLVADV